MNAPEKHLLLGKGEQFDIIFDHEKHGRLTLSAGQNSLTNDWMWWWSGENSMYAGTKSDVQGLVKSVRQKADKIHFDTFWRDRKD
jgi:hypothetical protein